jgi:hypothetical protein
MEEGPRSPVAPLNIKQEEQELTRAPALIVCYKSLCSSANRAAACSFASIHPRRITTAAT